MRILEKYIDEVTPYTILRLVIKQFKYLIYIYIFGSVFAIIMCPSIGLATLLFNINFIFLLGIILSVTLHEYGHVYMVKKLSSIDKIKIIIKMNSFSIVPIGQTSGKKTILIALCGPGICALIGLGLVLIGKYLNSLIIVITGGFYLTHVIDIIPLFGDGKMIIKGIIDCLFNNK